MLSSGDSSFWEQAVSTIAPEGHNSLVLDMTMVYPTGLIVIVPPSAAPTSQAAQFTVWASPSSATSSPSASTQWHGHHRKLFTQCRQASLEAFGPRAVCFAGAILAFGLIKTQDQKLKPPWDHCIQTLCHLHQPSKTTCLCILMGPTVLHTKALMGSLACDTDAKPPTLRKHSSRFGEAVAESS